MRESSPPQIEGRWRRRGNIPGTSQAIKTALAMATLEPRVTEGECCSRKREHQPVHARKKVAMTATLPDTTIRSRPSQRFSSRHIGPAVEDQDKMLALLGHQSLEELVAAAVPASIRGGQGVFGIALGGVWRDIEGTLSELPAERAEADEPHLSNDELSQRRHARTTG